MTRYTLQARLEAGELADLYRGEREDGSPIAAKVFAPKTSDPAYGKTLAEISARAAALHDGGMLAYTDIGFYDRRLVAVRDHVSGYTLGEAFTRLASREAVITAEMSLFLVAEAARIAGAAHAAGFAHGAITPGNLLVTFEGSVHLCDFGALEALASSAALKQFGAKGRSGYRAPEIKAAGVASPTDDVYSLGSILYELLTLTPLASVRTGKLSTKRDGVQPPSRIQRRINQRIDPVVMRAVEMVKVRRFPDANEMDKAIRALFPALGVNPTAQGLVKFTKELFPTEVKIVGDGGEPPFKTKFSLEPIADAPSLDVAPDDPETLRHSFTGTDTRAVDVTDDDMDRITSPESNGLYEEADAAADVSKVTDGPEMDSGTFPTQEVRPPTMEWYAPPGKMDSAVMRHRAVAQVDDIAARPAAATPAEAAPPKPVAQKREPSVPKMKKQAPVQTPAPSGEMSASLIPPTKHDWHAPPPEPDKPKPPPPKNWGLWGYGLLIAAGVSAMTLFAFKRYARQHGQNLDIQKTLTQALEAPVDVNLHAFKETLEPTAVKPPPDIRKPGTLVLKSDQPAWVVVDDANLKKKTPIAGYAVPPGRHVIRFVNVKSGIRVDEEVDLHEGETKTVTGKFRKAGGTK